MKEDTIVVNLEFGQLDWLYGLVSKEWYKVPDLSFRCSEEKLRGGNLCIVAASGVVIAQLLLNISVVEYSRFL